MMAYHKTLWCEKDVKERWGDRRKLLQMHVLYMILGPDSGESSCFRCFQPATSVWLQVQIYFASNWLQVTSKDKNHILKERTESRNSVIMCYLCSHGHRPRSFPLSTSHSLLSPPERERKSVDDGEIRVRSWDWRKESVLTAGVTYKGGNWHHYEKLQPIKAA